jgi:hypothetical protein
MDNNRQTRQIVIIKKEKKHQEKKKKKKEIRHLFLPQTPFQQVSLLDLLSNHVNQ